MSLHVYYLFVRYRFIEMNF